MSLETKLYGTQVKVLLAIARKFWKGKGVLIGGKRYVLITLKDIEIESKVAAGYLPQVVNRLEFLGWIHTVIKKSDRTYKYYRVNG